ncbi:MAG TPA: hypothetical protein VFG87_29290 [Amycolatopsis sp.]|jgi:hypothetical protein|nr:hypothetical protein [Amycolatopsis sp.]
MPPDVTSESSTSSLGDHGGHISPLRESKIAGHTPQRRPQRLPFTGGQSCEFHEPTGALLIGDAVFHNKRLGLGPTTFAADPTAQAASLSRLPARVTAVGFGHGDPLPGPVMDTFHAFLGKATERK